MGNWLSDKYAEGTIGHRFYAGCRNIDTVEAVAAEHARELFGAEYAYVQPHSGIDANLVAYWAILSHFVKQPTLAELDARTVNDLDEPAWARLRQALGNQRVMGMSLDAGGHLTHGFRHNISGKMFDQRSYGTDPRTGLLDYAALRQQAREFKPLILVAGYSAYPRRIDFAKMREIGFFFIRRQECLGSLWYCLIDTYLCLLLLTSATKKQIHTSEKNYPICPIIACKLLLNKPFSAAIMNKARQVNGNSHPIFALIKRIGMDSNR